MKRYIFALTLLFFSTNAAADSFDVSNIDSGLRENSSTFLNFQGEPSTVVGGCVNALTGTFIDQETDIVLPGPGGLHFTRTYAHTDHRFGSLKHSWNHNLFSFADYDSEPYGGICVIGDSGAEMAYNTILTEKARYAPPGKRRVFSSIFQEGVTNCGAGIIGGRYHLKNNYLVFKHNYRECTLTSSNGLKHYYMPAHIKGKRRLYRTYTDRTNGTKVIYKYHHKKLEEVSLLNAISKLTQSLKFEYASNGKQLVIHTHDGRAITYEFEKFEHRKGNSGDHERFLLRSVKRPNLPDVAYEYEPATKDSLERVKKKSYADSRCLLVDYYQFDKKGSKGKESQKTKEDIQVNKVWRIKKSDNQENPETILTFQYSVKPISLLGKSIPQKTTDVFDAYNHRTEYKSSYNRLDSITYYKGVNDYQPFYTDRMHWKNAVRNTGEEASPKPEFSDLISRTLEDGNGNIILCRSNLYDENSNVILETTWGNLTGKNSAPIILGENSYPILNGIECYEKSFSYSDNGKNLLRYSSIDGIGTHYSYKHGTDLLRAKYTIFEGKVSKREFWSYDTDGAVTEEVVDDAGIHDQNNWPGATQRFTKRIVNTQGTHAGLPETIIESYVDMTVGYEKILKKTINHYDAFGQLSQQDIYDSNNVFAYSLYWEYDAKGNVILEKDALGRVTTRKYDDNKNLIYEQGPNSEYHKEYVYNFANKLIEDAEVYNGSGASKRLVKKYAYNLIGNKISETDIYGNTTRYAYDEFGQVIMITYPEVPDEVGNLTAPVIKKKYDILGNVIEVTDPRGYTTRTEYTVRGKPFAIYHPDGTTERFEYDLKGNLIKKIAPNGTTTVITYDSLARPIRTEMFDASGNLLSAASKRYNIFHLLEETNAAGDITSYKYDSAGRLYQVEGGGAKTTYFYDNLGRQSEVHEAYGEGEGQYVKRIKKYDLLNRVLAEIVEDSSGNVFSSEQYAYDEDGNRTSASAQFLEGPAVTMTLYDAEGQPIMNEDALGNRTLFHYSYDYRNKWGQFVAYAETVDPLGYKTAIVKDAMGRDVFIEKSNPFGIATKRTNNYYDAAGNLVRQIETVIAPGHEDRFVETVWVYDSLGREIAVIEADGTPEKKATRYFYNAYGEKERVVKNDGVEIFHKYDGLGRLVEYYSSDGTVHYEYQYDQNDNPVQVRDLIHQLTTVRTFDSKKRVEREVLGNGLTAQFTYDRLGRPIAITLPDQSSVEYGYECLNLSEIKRLSPTGENIYVHKYLNFDLGGRLKKCSMIGNAGELEYHCDKLGRVVSIHSEGWKEKDIIYNGNGNIVSRSVEDGGGAMECAYEFDDLSQLSSETGLASHKYSYDSLYNRMTKDGNQYDINALNQILNDDKAKYEYDRAGRLSRKAAGANSIEYAYDALDRLTEIVQGGNRWVYIYDEENRRLFKKSYRKGNSDSWVEEEVVRYFYQGKNEAGACDGDGIMSQCRVLGLGKGAEIGAAVAIELGGRAYAPVHDHNGNVVCLLDSSTGQVFESYRSSALGEEEPGDYANPWRFSSKRVDEETGFVYFGRRYYDPEMGRWTTPDPLGFDGGPNLYAFILNNPLTHFDLYGLMDEGLTPWMEREQPWYFKPMSYLGAGIQYFGDHLCIKPWGGIFSRLGYLMQGNDPDQYSKRCQNPHSGNHNVDISKNHPKAMINFGCGILNTVEECSWNAKILSDACGGYNVCSTYSCSYGLLYDLLDCAALMLGVKTHSVRECIDGIRNNIRQVGGVGNGGCVYVHRHSRGGLVLDRALKYLTPEEKSMLHVRTYGSAHMVNDSALASSINYVSKSDPVPLLADPLGYFKGLFSKNSNVVFLDSDKFFGLDHAFEGSKAYKLAWGAEGKKFTEKYGTIK